MQVNWTIAGPRLAPIGQDPIDCFLIPRIRYFSYFCYKLVTQKIHVNTLNFCCKMMWWSLCYNIMIIIYEDMVTLTCCQDNILTEKIWYGLNHHIVEIQSTNSGYVPNLGHTTNDEQGKIVPISFGMLEGWVLQTRYPIHPSMHYWLRPFEGVQFRFDNVASYQEQNVLMAAISIYGGNWLRSVCRQIGCIKWGRGPGPLIWPNSLSTVWSHDVHDWSRVVLSGCSKILQYPGK